MHPTRTTTKLLLGVACAVSAVSGCVNVTPAPTRPAAAPGTPGAAPRHEPRGGPGAAPVVVEAPALEALKARAGRAGGPGATTAGAGGRGSAAGDGAARATGAGPGSADAGPPVPDIPEPRSGGEPGGHGDRSGRPGHTDHSGRAGEDDGRPGLRRPHRQGPEGQVPRELARELPVRPADVCALGRRHGRWHPDSPEARICAGVQGG
ncbi:hypothetical protein [Streptomyces sp. NPDC091268]|uniref:hypothetical protein n=1 Tax=Streptomyces sp. NPDC091268 TaxID=3365979 RepID=UPI003820F18D